MNDQYEIDGTPGLHYIHNLEHRNGNPNKSQWLISLLEERNCFANAIEVTCTNGMPSKHEVWGLHLVDNKPQYLGESASASSNPEHKLFIAKFVDGTDSNIWHGYPADYMHNHQDKPTNHTLLAWQASGHITPSQMRKIVKAQRCKL